MGSSNLLQHYADQLNHWLSRSFDDVFDVVKVMGIGIDLRRYMQFLGFRPVKGWIEVTLNPRTDHEEVMSSTNEKASVGDDDWEFCLDFVVEFAFVISSN